MPYVDGFIVPVPTKKLNAYWKIAKLAGKVWKDHGALEYVECVADDVQKGKWTSFPRSVKLKRGEMVIFSYIVYKSRARPRPHHEEGDDRQAARQDDGPEDDAVRRQAHDLGRLQEQGGGVALSSRARERVALARPGIPITSAADTGFRIARFSASGMTGCFLSAIPLHPASSFRGGSAWRKIPAIRKPRPAPAAR